MWHSSSSVSFSFSASVIGGSSNGNGWVSASRHTQQVTSNPSGTTVRNFSHNLGEAPVRQVRHFDSRGREVLAAPAIDTTRRIEDVSDEVSEAEKTTKDRENERRIQGGSAKREGSA